MCVRVCGCGGGGGRPGGGGFIDWAGLHGVIAGGGGGGGGSRAQTKAGGLLMRERADWPIATAIELARIADFQLPDTDGIYMSEYPVGSRPSAIQYFRYRPRGFLTAGEREGKKPGPCVG